MHFYHHNCPQIGSMFGAQRIDFEHGLIIGSGHIVQIFQRQVFFFLLRLSSSTSVMQEIGGGTDHWTIGS